MWRPSLDTPRLERGPDRLADLRRGVRTCTERVQCVIERAMVNTHPLDAAVERIRGWAYSDSTVNLDKCKLRELLAADVETTGTALPTEDEAMAFVCGGDDGVVPAGLVKRFPLTHAWLEEFWR